MNQLLEKISAFVTELNESNSQTHKVEVIKKYKDDEDIRWILNETLSSFHTFGVTSKQLIKNAGQSFMSRQNLPDLLTDLKRRYITGHAAIGAVNGFINENIEYKDLIHNIIDKNLKTRVDASLVNKAIPGLIEVFDVVLAEKYHQHVKKVDLTTGQWFVSRKLDGIRCVVVVEDGKALAFTRTGNAITTVQKILDAVEETAAATGHPNFVLDGELCITDEFGDEDFAAISSEWNKKGHTIESPKYIIFDCIPVAEFRACQGATTLSERLVLRNLVVPADTQYLKRLGLVILDKQDFFDELKQIAAERGWEGLMLRKDVGYEGKRTTNLLKVKEMQDAEYTVLRIETGPFRTIQGGKEVEMQTMTNVIIEHKGNEVSVGSGYTLGQRHRYYNNPELIIGKEITVQYFQECSDQKTGLPSLRFPVCKKVFEEGKRNN